MDVPVFLRAVLLVLTGAGAVAYELAAVESFTALFGSTAESAAAVVAVFLGALAIGARVIGRLADRSARPVRLFAVVAVLGGAAAALGPWLLDRSGDALLRTLFGADGPLRVGALLAGALLVVGPAGLLLGGTLPALTSDAVTARSIPGRLYAANTFGAVLGLGLAGFLLLERLGNLRTAMAAGVLIAGAGAAAWAVGRDARESDRDAAGGSAGGRLAFAVAAAALLGGFAALALQMLATRLLMQFLHGSAWSFAAVLLVFLIGLTAGGALGAKLLDAGFDARRAASALLAALGAGVAVAGPVIVAAGESIEATAMRGVGPQLALSLAVLPATLASGALFAVLLGPRAGATDAGTHVGRVTLWNTVGGILGSLLSAFVLVPAFGTRPTLLIVALAAVVGALVTARSRGTVAAAAGGLGVALGALLAVDLRAIPDDPVFTERIAYREGRLANVAVLGRPGERRPVLYINRTARQGGGDEGRALERKQGLLPVALKHGDVRTALVLGVGTGGTVEGLLEARVPSIHAVELVGGVLDVLPLFAEPGRDLSLQPSVELFHEDAVTFARATPLKYDLVVGDLFFPWQDGAGRLYSVEHFRAVKERLADGGVYCQWIPLYQLRWEDFGLIARTFSRAFPQTMMFLARLRSPHPMVGLVGSVDRLSFDRARLDALFGGRDSAAWAAVGLRDAFDLFGLYVGDQYTIDAAFSGGEALGDDAIVTLDRPLVEYRAARTEEIEPVLALNNIHNVERALGGTLVESIEREPDRTEEERGEFETRVNRRLAAQAQALQGYYWKLRGRLEPTDPERLVETEASRCIAGLTLDPTHPELNEAAADLCARRLKERRFSDVVGFASEVLQRNPGNVEVARSLGTAALLLGEAENAISALEHTVSLDDDDVANRMLLGMARFLAGDEEGAREDLDRSFARASEGYSAVAFAMRAALAGEREVAAEALRPMLDHPVWGVLARRTLARVEGDGAAAPREGS